MRALILSAGFGDRLKPYTLKRAKPAITFLNVPMLGFPYYWLSTLDLSDVVFNTHYLPDTIQAAAKSVVAPGVNLHFTHEDAILGSGGGIWNARPHLDWDDDFAVANGDGAVTFDEPDTLERLLAFHREKKALATLLVCPHEGVGTRLPGVWLDPYDEVVNFGKAAKRDGLRCLHYASYMIFSKRIWNYLPEGESNILYDVLELRIAQGERVFGFVVNNMRWFETGNPVDYLASTRICLEMLRDQTPSGSALRRLLDRQASPFFAHSRLDRLQLIADSAEVAPSATIEGFSVIGNECRIGASARLENCVVLDGTQVADHSIHKNEILI